MSPQFCHLNSCLAKRNWGGTEYTGLTKMRIPGIHNWTCNCATETIPECETARILEKKQCGHAETSDPPVRESKVTRSGPRAPAKPPQA